MLGLGLVPILLGFKEFLVHQKEHRMDGGSPSPEVTPVPSPGSWTSLFSSSASLMGLWVN